MPARKLDLHVALPPELAAGLAAIRAELEVPGEFPPEVTAEAASAAAEHALPELDRTDLELVTIDPEGSMDLDQAVLVTRSGIGYTVYYAIADVASFVVAGRAVDGEAHRRGETFYAPDSRVPLHPLVLSEAAASLLPDQVRPALLWTVSLDGDGNLVDAEVRRARVRSRVQLSYPQAQDLIDSGQASESLQLLRTVGELREQRERDRGGVSLQIPEQEVLTGDGHWRLEFRAPLPVEGWNAQISLLTGMAAAQLMLYGQIGILRTLPPADNGSVRRLRQVAKALHLRWPAEVDYPAFVHGLEPTRPADGAMMWACTSLFRGAGYCAFSGGIPDHVEHAALAVEYAHCTAPLRRLVDRYTGEICLALCADAPVPDWVRTGMDALPGLMAEADRRAKRYERAVVDLVEVWTLRDQVGETFVGTILDVDERRKRGTIQIADPAVEATVRGENLPLGQELSVRLAGVDLQKRTCVFEPAAQAAVPGM